MGDEEIDPGGCGCGEVQGVQRFDAVEGTEPSVSLGAGERVGQEFEVGWREETPVGGDGEGVIAASG